MEPEVIRPRMLERQEIVIGAALAGPYLKPAIDGERTERRTGSLLRAEAEAPEFIAVLTHDFLKGFLSVCRFECREKRHHAPQPLLNRCKPLVCLLPCSACALCFFEIPLGIPRRSHPRLQGDGGSIREPDVLRPAGHEIEVGHEPGAETLVLVRAVGRAQVFFNGGPGAERLGVFLAERGQKNLLPVGEAGSGCAPGNEMPY